MKTPNVQGFARQSTTATVCEMLATRKRDAFHDIGHWSYALRAKRALEREKRKARRAAVLAAL